ncbi:hypothetical protein WR25_21318 [Diploscapter pachys]|uniref:Uncharacterized protein n=1 Tax=Diploscapter pachys TaxID=2018661 RepID=A0A2A2K2A9_9BILA|nr:hypothetical protein WR25_21318 [Diploscapter pachys]
MRGVAPFQLDQARMAFLHRGLPDRVDHRIVGGERVAARDGERRMMLARQLLGGQFQLGRPEVAGAGVDEVADQRGRGGDAQHLFDPRRIAGQQDAGPGVVGAAIAVEAILPQHPAERRRTDLARDAIGASRQRLGKLGERPRVGGAGDGDAVDVLVDEHRRAARLAGEALRGERGAHPLRLATQPRVIGIGGDQVDRAGGLSTVGLEQGIGHVSWPGTRGIVRSAARHRVPRRSRSTASGRDRSRRIGAGRSHRAAAWVRRVRSWSARPAGRGCSYSRRAPAA